MHALLKFNYLFFSNKNMFIITHILEKNQSAFVSCCPLTSIKVLVTFLNHSQDSDFLRTCSAFQEIKLGFNIYLFTFTSPSSIAPQQLLKYSNKFFTCCLNVFSKLRTVFPNFVYILIKFTKANLYQTAFHTLTKMFKAFNKKVYSTFFFLFTIFTRFSFYSNTFISVFCVMTFERFYNQVLFLPVNFG